MTRTATKYFDGEKQTYGSDSAGLCGCPEVFLTSSKSGKIDEARTYGYCFGCHKKYSYNIQWNEFII